MLLSCDIQETGNGNSKDTSTTMRRWNCLAIRTNMENKSEIENETEVHHGQW